MAGKFTFELDLPPGLSSDDTTFATKGRWADGNNVRFRNGKPQTIEGWTSLITIPGGTRCLNMLVMKDNSGALYAAYGMETKLYVGSALNVPADKTPVGFVAADAWSFAPWGNVLLASPRNGKLYQHTLGGGVATHVTQAPAAITAMLVTQERQVMALGCNEELSGTFNSRCIRWTHTEDFTNWTTSNSNLAGEYVLAATGDIVGGALVGQYVAVWTDSDLYLGQFTADPGNPWRFDRVDGGCGLLGSSAVCVHNGVAYWLAPDLQIYRWIPGAPPEPLPCPISRDFTANFYPDVPERVILTAVPHYHELWLHYPDLRESAPARATRYIAVSLKDGAWFRGQMTRSAVQTRVLDILGQDTPYGYLTADGTTVYTQATENNADGSALNWHIQSADQYIHSGKTRVMVRGCEPDFEDQIANVSLTLFVRDRPQSSATTKGPFTLATSTTKKDFRASGRLMAVKFSGGAASGSFARLGKPTFDCVTLGER